MARYGMVIDLNYCIGCYCCQIACKDEHVGNAFAGYTKAQPTYGHFWVGIKEVEQALSPSHVKVTYIPKLSQSRSILKAAKDGAAYQRPDGIVMIDPAKAAGQKELVSACPTGAVFWNEEEQVAQKCTFCAHLLDDGWTEPRCVQACPTECMIFGDLDDASSRIAKFVAEHKGELEPLYHDEDSPNVLYRGLPKPYITGTVIFADTAECAGGVKVTLTEPSGAAAACETDCFGDFRFKVAPNGQYTVRIEGAGYNRQVHEVDVANETVYLGDLNLSPAGKGFGM